MENAYSIFFNILDARFYITTVGEERGLGQCSKEEQGRASSLPAVGHATTFNCILEKKISFNSLLSNTQCLA